MVEGLEEAGSDQMLVAAQILQPVDRAGGNFGLAQDIEPFGGAALHERFAGQRVEFVDVARAVGHGPEARILGQFGPADQGPEAPPLGIGIGEDADIAVGGRMRPPPAGQRAGIAGAGFGRHEDRAVLVLDQGIGGQPLEHRGLDIDPLAGAQALHHPGQDTAGGQHARRLVGDHGRDQHGRTVARDEAAGDAGLALNHIVIGRPAAIGPVLAVAVQRAVDDGGIAGEDRIRIEAQTGDLLRPDVVDEGIGRIDQPPEGVARGLGLEVEHDAALVAIRAHEDRAHPGAAGRADGAGDIALRRFDLDDLGPEIAQQLGRVRPVDHRRQVEDTQPGQGQGAGAGHRRAQITARSRSPAISFSERSSSSR